jgi:hypothetical protein
MPSISSRILLSHGISDTPNSVSLLLRRRRAFHRPLKMKQRRAQKEKYGKRAHRRVRNPVPQDVPPVP